MKLSKVLSVFALAALAACSPEFKYDVTPADTLELETTTVKFLTADPGSKTVEVEASAGWKAVTDTAAKWVSVEKGDGILTITAEKNPGIVTRETVVTVSAGNRTVGIKVSQAGGDVSFALGSEEVTGGPAALAVPVEVASNLTWTIVPNVEWILPSVLEGGFNTSVTINTTENVSLSSRTGYAYFYNEDELLGRIMVTQDGIVPGITLDVESISEGSAAFSKEIKVTSTWAWEVYTSKMDSLWITVTPPAAREDGLLERGSSIPVTIAAPAGGVARTGTVYFKTEDKVYPVTVSQTGGATELSISKDTFAFTTAAASSDSFDVTTNNFWEIVDVPAWITLDKAQGAAGTTKVTLSAQQRKGSPRSVVITVKAGDKSHQITVSQPAGAYTVPLEYRTQNANGTWNNYALIFTEKFKSSGNDGYNLGVLPRTLKADPEITLEFFVNLGYIVGQTANGVRISLIWKNTAVDPSKSNAIRDEDFAYVKFPAIEGLTLKKVTCNMRAGATALKAYITTDAALVSNAAAAAAALTATSYSMVTGDNTFTLSSPQPNTAYYLFMATDPVGAANTYDYNNMFLYYE